MRPRPVAVLLTATCDGSGEHLPRNSMTEAEITAELALVSAAISAILQTGQSVTVDGQTLTRADLAALREHRKALQQELAATQNGGHIQAQVEFLDP